tara:strand:- start:428 stop:841 length:414 start_codon:yes stop_codon:yes gene_type:complete
MATEKTIWYQQNHISHGRATSTQEFKRGVGGRWGSISRVEEWAEKRGLINENGPLPLPDKQMIKLLEEVGETARALLYDDMDELRDGIGDCVVCLIVLAAQCNMTLEECMDAAWDEIKDRSGKLENGLFKKDGDFDN